MKLLFDENLSRKLPQNLALEYPGSDHVIQCGLGTADDMVVRQFAAEQGFIIVTRDADFAKLDALLGSPPKTIWVACENAPTREYARLLRTLKEQIEAFAADPERSVLIIG